VNVSDIISFIPVGFGVLKRMLFAAGVIAFPSLTSAVKSYHESNFNLAESKYALARFPP